LSSTSNIEIRLAGSGDAAAIAALLAQAFAEYEPLYTPDGYAATAITRERVISRIEEGPVWVAFSDQRILGTVSVVARGESLYVRGMAVSPKARGRLIGRLLMTHIEQFAQFRAIPRLYLSSTPFLGRAIRLYERSGFQRTTDGPTDLFGTPLFTMEKVLSG
jgi:GNAT superfamily N-acetyltransferase